MIFDAKRITGEPLKPYKSERAQGGLLWALLALLALLAGTAVALAGVAFFAAQRFEERDLSRERALAESALRAELEEMASQARDRAWWDEAIEKLVMSPDDLFADDNIGSYLFEDFEISIAAVIHPDGSRGFTFLNGENRTDDKIPDMFAGLFRELHDEANTAGMAEPEAHARYVRVEDRTLVLAAAAMTHENPTLEQLQPRVRPTLLFGRPLSGAFQVKVAQHYLLQDGQAVAEVPAAPGSEQFASVPITGHTGETVGHVIWRHDPGAALFKQELTRTVVLAMLSLLIVGGLFAVYLWQTRRMANATSAAMGEEKRLLDQRSHLLTTIAHDLKTPLTAMQSAVDLLLHFGGKLDDEEKRGELQLIQEHILLMDNVISEALEPGKENGQDFRPTSTDPAEAVRELWRRQLPDADRALELTDVRTRREPEMIDRSLFDQAIGNVLSNALKYGADGTPVRVRLSRDEGRLIVVIVDKGRGVPAGEIGRLTETFFRASNSGAATGVGLGLSIASRAAVQHGGKLEIGGTEGEGLQVTLAFDVSGSHSGGVR